MEFSSPQFADFTQEVEEIAERFDLDPDKLEVEFYTPNCQAIVVEEFKGHRFEIHISLEENRIISIKNLSANGNGTIESLKEKYRRYMK